jgi:hypothetical protein
MGRLPNLDALFSSWTKTNTIYSGGNLKKSIKNATEIIAISAETVLCDLHYP